MAPSEFNRIIAVVVTYNIGEPFFHHLKTYLKQVSQVIIVDNSTELISQKIVATIASSLPSRVQLIANGKNIGLAKAQNLGIEKALALKADWVLLLDDDSAAEKDMIKGLQKTYHDYVAPEHVGIIAPVIEDRNSHVTQPFMCSSGPFWFKRIRVQTDHMQDDVMAVIASGSLVRSTVFEEVGLMQATYSIDYVDTEFCMRASCANFTILASGDATLYHSIGAKTAHRFLFWRVVCSNHSPKRRFSIYRNRVLMWRAFWKKVPGYVVYDMLASVFDVWRIVCFEKEKGKKLKQVIKGFKKGLTSKLPKAPQL